MDPTSDTLLLQLEGLKLEDDLDWRAREDHADLDLRGVDFDASGFEIRDGSFEGRVRFLVSKARRTIAGNEGIESRIYGGTVEGAFVAGEPVVQSVRIDRYSEGEIEMRALTGQAEAAE